MNNYFHDLSVSLLALSAFAGFLLARYAERDGEELVGLFVYIRPKLNLVTVWSALFFVFGGMVRLYSLPEFEWADAVRNNQLVGLKAKFVMLAVLLVLGMYFWIVTIRKERKRVT